MTNDERLLIAITMIDDERNLVLERAKRHFSSNLYGQDEHRCHNCSHRIRRYGGDFCNLLFIVIAEARRSVCELHDAY